MREKKYHIYLTDDEQGKNRVEGRQSKTAYPEKHSRQSDGGFCLQGIGALQQVFA